MHNIEEIYVKYFKTVYKYLFYLTHNADLSEELAQETFYKAITKIHTFKGQCKLSTWLCTIAKNLLYNEIKKKKVITLVNEKELDFLTSNEGIEDTIVLNEEKAELHNNIERLDLMTQQVINLRINQGLSFKEIGNILGKNENWARVIFYRGKIKLQGGDVSEEK